MDEIIIDGCNVAECNKYCKFDNRNEPNKCYNYIYEGYSDCKPKEYQCFFYVKEIEKQLQRAKAEKQDLINYYELREGGMLEDIQHWKNKAQEFYKEFEQYKKSKQASYEAMQKQWNNAINENRLLRTTLKNKNFVAIAEENERLKAENEKLKNRNKLYKKIIVENQQKYHNQIMVLKACIQGDINTDDFKNYAKFQQENKRLKKQLKGE